MDVKVDRGELAVELGAPCDGPALRGAAVLAPDPRRLVLREVK
ncbi:hypothetical protein [Tsukamurella ocularis]